MPSTRTCSSEKLHGQNLQCVNSVATLGGKRSGHKKKITGIQIIQCAATL